MECYTSCTNKGRITLDFANTKNCTVECKILRLKMHECKIPALLVPDSTKCDANRIYDTTISLSYCTVNPNISHNI